MTNKKTVCDIDISGKTVLVRVDYNVPFKPNTTDISDDSRWNLIEDYFLGRGVEDLKLNNV